MIRKIFIVFALALSLQLISGCVDCNCGPVKNFYFTKKGLTAKNVDSSLPEPMITNSNVVKAVDYGFQINFISEQIALNRESVKLGLMQTAQACSCATDSFYSKEYVLSFEIFSDKDFDASHLKNTDLSAYFKLKRHNALIPIANYIRVPEYLNYIPKENINENFLLQVAPTLNKKHKFRLKMTLSDGRILEAETTEVELI